MVLSPPRGVVETEDSNRDCHGFPVVYPGTLTIMLVNVRGSNIEEEKTIYIPGLNGLK